MRPRQVPRGPRVVADSPALVGNPVNTYPHDGHCAQRGSVDLMKEATYSGRSRQCIVMSYIICSVYNPLAVSGYVKTDTETLIFANKTKPSVTHQGLEIWTGRYTLPT